MNSRERVMAMVAGEPTDRPVFSATLSLYGAALTGCPLQRYYTDPNAYSAGQDAIAQAFASDIIFTPFSVPIEGEVYGSRVAFFEDQPPNIVRPAISSSKEIASLQTPDVESHPRLMYIRDTLRMLVSAHRSQRAIAGIALSPMDSPLMIMGIEGWMETVLFDPQGVRSMLDVTGPFFVRWVNSLLSDGADFIVLPVGMLSPSVVTRQIAEDVTRPALAEALAEVNGPVVLHHTGGSCMRHLDLFAGLPNVIGVVIDSRDDPGEAREILGPDMVLFAGPSGPDMPEYTAEQITADCAERLVERHGDPRFVLATTAADVPLATRAENIHAMRRAVQAQAGGKC
ncbi:MAG: uroporphyrinogen decarboxylase [Phycisphaerales bacterium]|jgi:uroporphyrinogen decarboxylase|nr:uroporphyrinogen decarboxylase [Phycisphaerales bacterium]